ncbi:MAG: T9SS type A sorting domain-containing protein [Bacteroidota bacterium]
MKNPSFLPPLNSFVGLLLILLFSTQITTAQTNIFKFGTIHVAPGSNTVIMPITIQCQSGISAMAFESNFNATLLTYVGMTYSSPKFLIGSSPVVTVQAGGHLNFAWYSLVPQTFGNDTLLKLKFQFNGSGSSAFVFDTLITGSCEIDSSFSSTGVPNVLPFTFVNGQVDNLFPKDGGITEITSPNALLPQGGPTTVVVKVRNFGGDTLNSVHVSYRIDNNPVITQTLPGTINSLATINFSFSPAITIASGSHSICAWTTLSTLDSNAINDTLCKSFYIIPVGTIPYVDDFEGPGMFTAGGTGGTSWIHDTVNPGQFPNYAHSLHYLWGTNLNMSSGYSNNANCTLSTPLIAFNGIVNASLSFWMKRHIESGISGNDGCMLEYSIDNGNNWLLLGTVNDPNGVNWYNGTIAATTPASPAWTGNAVNWIKSSYQLSIFNAPFNGNVRFRFRFASSAFITDAGVFIDDFRISKTYNTDAGIDSIYSPNGAEPAGAPLHVKVRIHNFGLNSLTSIPISYIIGNSPQVNSLWIGLLNPGDTTTYTFPPYPAPQGNFCMKAFTSLPNDSAQYNDTASTCAYGIPEFSVPYLDTFDSATNPWYTEGGVNSPSQWERGSPINASINAPYSAPNCWKTKINGNYAFVVHPDILYSPLFNLSNGYDSLAFYHWVDTYSGDKSRVEFLAIDNNGQKTWKILGSMGDPNSINWYNSGSSGFINDGGMPGWHRSAYDLTILPDIANPVQFRFFFYCYYPNNHSLPYAGWAIDNFELTSVLNPYAGTLDPAHSFLQISPNPCDKRSDIRFDNHGSGEGILSIINGTGQQLFTKQTGVKKGSNKISIDTSGFPPGLYVVSIEFQGKRVTQKMMVSH